MSQISDYGSVDEHCNGCGKKREKLGRFHLERPFPTHPAAWHSERLFLHHAWSLDATDFLRIPVVEPSAEDGVDIVLGRHCAIRTQAYHKLCHTKALLCCKLVEELRTTGVTNPREFDAWSKTESGIMFITREANAWEAIQLERGNLETDYSVTNDNFRADLESEGYQDDDEAVGQSDENNDDDD